MKLKTPALLVGNITFQNPSPFKWFVAKEAIYVVLIKLIESILSNDNLNRQQKFDEGNHFSSNGFQTIINLCNFSQFIVSHTV